MIRGRKVRTVAAFEFISTVKRKGYLIAVFGMPVFLSLYGLVIAGVGFAVASKEKDVRVFGIVDGTGLLGHEGDVARPAVDMPDEIRAALEAAGRGSNLPAAAAGWSGSFVFRSFPDKATALEVLRKGEIKGFHVLPPDYLATGRVDMYHAEGLGLSGPDSRRALNGFLLERLLEGKLPEDLAQRVRKPIGEAVTWTVTDSGEVKPRSVMSVVTGIVVPLLFMVLLFVSIMMSAGYLIQATAVEKENKVVEVLLSSANPDEILVGKLLGLGGAGLLQILVWFGMLLVGGLVLAGTLSAMGVDIPWMVAPLGLVFFFVAYFFFGSLMLGSGSLGSNMKESQQLSMVWSLLAAVPMMFLGVLMQDPHGTIGKVLTWFPFTSAATVVFRMATDPAGIAWWEVVGSLLVLMVATWLAIRLGARLFRIGFLLTGTRPKLREILRQARLSSGA